MVKSPCYDKNGVKKGAWSPEEDEKLRTYILRYGHWNWRELPRFAGLARCGKSCRLRWMNYLRPNVKRGSYSKAEDDLIIKLHQQFGNKWSVIATSLPGRTDNEIKNHWHTRLKKRLAAKQNPPPSQLKQHSTKTSQMLELENGSLADDGCPQILESCPLSPELSSSEFSDYALVSGLNWVGKDSISSSEIFEDLNEDFWTKPFVGDNFYIQNDFPSNFSEGGGFTSPYVSYYGDSLDLFYPS